MGDWLMSPGFGGTAATFAAVIGFFGVSRTIGVQRESNRKQQWWGRARWALDLTLSDDTTTRTIGLEVLDALGRSEYVGEHEFELVDAAVAPTLDAYADQRGHDYLDDGDAAKDEADLKRVDEEEEGL